MKSLTNYLNEAKKKDKGTTTWQKAYFGMFDVHPHEITKAYLEKIQKDEWIWDITTEEPATPELLIELYTEYGNENVEWEYEDLGNQFAYELKDNKGHFISFDCVETIRI